MATYLKRAGQKLESTLNISYGGQNIIKSLERQYQETSAIKKTVDATDLGVEVIQVDKKWTNACQINPYESFREFLEVAKSIQDTSTSSTRYGKIFALRDLLSEINSLKDINTATALKIKILIEGKINGIKKDIKNNQKFADQFLDKM